MSPAQVLQLTYVGYLDRGDVYSVVSRVQERCPSGWNASYTVGSQQPTSPGAVLVGGIRGQHDEHSLWVFPATPEAITARHKL